MLIDKNAYRKSLSDLWFEVFGDEYSFIELIFNEKYTDSILCFAELADGKAVSAFYLIKNELTFEGRSFSGYYLYAAATLPAYRGRGIMSKLIRQAQEYCDSDGADYISLVPSEKSLYTYYSALGFESAMYRCVSEKAEDSFADKKGTVLEDASEILDIRHRYEGNAVNFAYDSFGYALDCMKYSGFEFIALSEDALLIDSHDDSSSSEFISSELSLAENLARLTETQGTLTSPFEDDIFSENKAVPYGMLYPINPLLEREWNFTDIYMNIALD